MATETSDVRGSARDPLLPITVIVTTICGVLAAWLVVRAYAQIGLGGAFGWGTGIICADDPYATVSIGNQSGLDVRQPGIVTSYVPKFCDYAPGGSVRLLSTLTEVPSFVLYLGSLLMLLLLIRTARRAGPYTQRTARQLRLFGWYLLLGSIVCHITESAARDALLSSFTTLYVPWDVLGGFPTFAVLTGIGLITLARIFRVGSIMREDLEGVV